MYRRRAPSGVPTFGWARAMLLLHTPWRVAGDLRGESEERDGFRSSTVSSSRRITLSLKVSVERAKASTRARNDPWEVPTQAEIADPVDFDEEAPVSTHEGSRRMRLRPFDWRYPRLRRHLRLVVRVARHVGGRFPREGDLCNMGRQMDRAVSIRMTSRQPPRGKAALGSPRDPYGANEEHRFQIALVLKTIKKLGIGAPRVHADAIARIRRSLFGEFLRYPLAYGLG